MLYRKILNCCPSKLVNAWRVRLGSKTFVVMPAHVAIHKKEGIFTVSKFLKDLSGLNWCVPYMYLQDQENFVSDVAWARVPDDEDESINVDTTGICGEQLSLPCKIFFRQPYDAMGSWDGSNSTLGQVDGQLYPSPNSKLFEVVDVGFRGMSGALVVLNSSDDNSAIGMLLRRGKPIDLKKSKSPLQSHPESSVITERTMSDVGAALDTPGLFSSKEQNIFHEGELTSPEFRAIGRMLMSMERNFNTRIDSMDSRINARMSSIESRMSSIKSDVKYLRDNVLVVDDLDALLNVTAMRRLSHAV